MQNIPTSFTVTVKPNAADTLPSYPLHDYRLTWDIYDETKRLNQGESSFSTLNSTQTVSGQVNGGLTGHKLQLHLALIRPTGEIAVEKTLDWSTSQQAQQLNDTAIPAR